jgi:DNA modification methylase
MGNLLGKLRLNEIGFDGEIYPRKQVSRKTVESYVEALKGGAVFPPIEVQRLKYKDGVEKIICLDGRHRVLAIEEFNKINDNKITEVEANFWRDESLDRDENLEELMIRSAVLNLRHGDRLESSDLANVVLKIIKARPIEQLNGLVSELAKKFGYSHSTISRLETSEGKVSDVLARIRLSRDYQIYRLLELGWSQREVGEIFGLSQRAIRKIGTNVQSNISSIQQLFNEGKSVEDVARFYNIDIVTAWSMILKGKSDLERFKLFGEAKYQDDSPRIFNVWNFTQCDPRLGQDHPGRIPGQIALNLLYYYTEQGELVVDPMAGGGSTIDACLVMGRRCRAYDINPVRKDILKWDLYDGFPREAMGCDLIFLDPPYWNLQKGFYVKESVSEVSLEEWLNFMERVIKESYKVVRKGGYVALITEAMVDERGTKEFYDLPFMCMKFFEETKFKEVHRISVPVTTQVKSHHDVDYAKQNKIILDIDRDLIIYRK